MVAACGYWSPGASQRRPVHAHARLDVARFVLKRVSFVKYSDAELAGAFISMLEMHLPTMADMRGSEIADFRKRCKDLVDGSTKGLISRQPLESALIESAPGLATAWPQIRRELRR